ncbi:MAG TPA: hypothetical protein VEP90_20920, partial [Methylomirabilota bacterium]|nr:hypothetical protein [Methylomirabilota bacterium]
RKKRRLGTWTCPCHVDFQNMVIVASVSVSGSKQTRMLGEDLLRKWGENKMLKDSLLGSVITQCYFSIRLYSCII